jgi:hypothetical protein
MSTATVASEDELYLNSIPYLEFPLLLAGRPFTGERALIPGIQYPSETECHWTHHCRSIWKYYQLHPDGPFSYGWWDSVPGRPQARVAHARWLRQYLPLVEEGTWAWLEINRSTLFKKPLPPNVVASVFANREIYLVLANYSHRSVEIESSYQCVATAAASEAPRKRWNLAGRSLLILQRRS